MSWEVQGRRGLWLPQIGWWLDAPLPVARSVVSHAHSDHLAAHREVICSAATAHLMQVRLHGSRTLHVLPFGQTEQLAADTTVTLLPAGHILGSAQCLLEREGHGRLLYTGDCNLRPSPAAEACVLRPAEVLIMETTFGLPRYRFPPTADVVAGIRDFCLGALADGATPVLFAYSLGKTQELLCALAGSGFAFALHPQSHRFTEIYRELGVALPPYEVWGPGSGPGRVVICPSQAAAFLQSIPRRRTAAVTGWALDSGATFRLQCDAAFPLSNHADFSELLALVDRVQPRLVYTVHGFAREFAQTLRARGIEAWALGMGNQLELDLGSGAPAGDPELPQED